MDELKPGPELDALVAEKVMGRKPPSDKWFVAGTLPRDVELFADGAPDDIGMPKPWYVPAYSTDIAAAWKVVEHLLGGRGWTIVLGSKRDEPGIVACRMDRCAMRNPEPGLRFVHIRAATVPHAICLAALHAVGAIPDAS